MEWAVRPFIARWPDVAMARLAAWTGHQSYHVRRLVSEGTRPKLPWAPALKLPFDQTLPLLDALHADGTRYVTRSVANHLIDIAKSDPGIVVDRLNTWQGEGRQDPSELRWMTAHAVRTLVKDGHPQALALVGFDPDLDVSLSALNVPAQVPIGGAMTVDVTLAGPAGAKVLVDIWSISSKPMARRRRKCSS